MTERSSPVAPAQMIGDAEYRSLAGFRQHMRGFFAFSEQTIQAAGVAPAQYQAMLAIRAHGTKPSITISGLAEQLMIRVNSAVELVQRLQAADMVCRMRSTADRRRIELSLTPKGSAVLAALAALHVDEHRRRLPELIALMETLLVA